MTGGDLMAVITDGNVLDMMRALRVSSNTAEADVTDLLQAFIVEMDVTGVYVSDITEPLCWQAAKLYCKSHYGYDTDTERYATAFSALRNSMALSGDYVKPEPEPEPEPEPNAEG